ncbi:galactose-specific lectin nattectin-like [Siniperca chuatsi]|uniref:galactose-specific lectin nattectin-like n=1 Tax=Siniperca chuatsi TaxID=119488 RepID=UPI001CE0DE8D|nr:galactose-specific lectin nattectin-like [Siniperca chuatsi]
MASGFHLAFFLCLTSGLLISLTRSTRIERHVAGCPHGWTQYGARCFIVQTGHRTMADAELTCTAFGGNLASISSYGEHLFIRNLIFRTCGSFVTTWIGLFDAIQEGKWLWTDGSRVVFTHWGHREPNNAGGEHCTETNFRESFWNDVPCHSTKPFVCARKV